MVGLEQSDDPPSPRTGFTFGQVGCCANPPYTIGISTGLPKAQESYTGQHRHRLIRHHPVASMTMRRKALRFSDLLFFGMPPAHVNRRVGLEQSDDPPSPRTSFTFGQVGCCANPPYTIGMSTDFATRPVNHSRRAGYSRRRRILLPSAPIAHVMLSAGPAGWCGCDRRCGTAESRRAT
jgi:hypothetical protein